MYTFISCDTDNNTEFKVFRGNGRVPQESFLPEIELCFRPLLVEC